MANKGGVGKMQEVDTGVSSGGGGGGVVERYEEGSGGEYAWMYSFGAAMIPFSAFCYAHSKGVTVRVVERMAKSPFGVYGLLALPFVTLGMEKCVYDTVQCCQGINPNSRPPDRGGFPSGGAALPSFSLIPIQTRMVRKTQ
eukprot:CAMPEP_0197830180 /NCGR_PEP_ID=MMETSP1437-20131217/6782_1 /TAXON_ID=49252 ORGANISM="Eucampia antarctica, Strain CCMP1452" /NCGR_SAMPLE_ID=MMETSP1437 /ASSEMBLY_ACC=CAM_ASM_001096 /LENGTH=140 /DNA_ID=CAMNT_0043432391 /DNA_START=54 /DNA_END=476 /DNA_ORIENTATION=-